MSIYRLKAGVVGGGKDLGYLECPDNLDIEKARLLWVSSQGCDDLAAGFDDVLGIMETSRQEKWHSKEYMKDQRSVHDMFIDHLIKEYGCILIEVEDKTI